MSASPVRSGHLLDVEFGEPLAAPAFYRKTGTAAGSTTVIDPGCAQTLLETAKDSGVLVTGDLTLGFAVRADGPLRHGFTVVPGCTTRVGRGLVAVTIELRWTVRNGHRLVRRWFEFFVSLESAELTVCCLWSRRSTGLDAFGRGAVSAVLVDAAGAVTEITEMRDTCAHFGPGYTERFASTMWDEFEPYPPTGPPRSPEMSLRPLRPPLT